jgi:hypothetical protein
MLNSVVNFDTEEECVPIINIVHVSKKYNRVAISGTFA